MGRGWGQEGRGGGEGVIEVWAGGGSGDDGSAGRRTSVLLRAASSRKLSRALS